MLPIRTIGLYTVLALAAATLHLLFVLLVPDNRDRYFTHLVLIVISYQVSELQHHQKLPCLSAARISYYLFLGTALLVLGEVALKVIDPAAVPRESVNAKFAVHMSLAWSWVARCEWWRTSFVCAPRPPSLSPRLVQLTVS